MRLTKKKNGQLSIPDVPTPIPISWGTKQYKRDYMNFTLQYVAMVEKLAAYEDETEIKCQPLDYILNMACYPYHTLKEVPQEEWKKLDYTMETFDKEDQDYNLEAMPLLALILRELLATPFARKRRDMICHYVPIFISGAWWDKLLDKYGLEKIKQEEVT